MYGLADSPPLCSLDLVTAATGVQGCVICRISVPAFHEVTTQVPLEVRVALPHGAEERLLL